MKKRPRIHHPWALCFKVGLLLLRHDGLVLARGVEHAHHIQEAVVIAEDQRRGDVEVPEVFGEFLGAVLIGGGERGGPERGDQAGRVAVSAGL